MVDDDAESSSCEIGARLICQQDRQKKTSYPHDTEQPPPLTLTLINIFMTYDKQIPSRSNRVRVNRQQNSGRNRRTKMNRDQKLYMPLTPDKEADGKTRTYLEWSRSMKCR